MIPFGPQMVRFHRDEVEALAKKGSYERGSPIRATAPVLRDDRLYWEGIYLPRELECSSCGLMLEGYALLHGAGLGGQFVEQHYAEPSEYYSPAEEYFEEYNNM